MKSTTNNKSIPTKNLENSVIDWAGESPQKSFVWNGKFTTRWGGKTKDNFGFSGDPGRQAGTVYDYRDGSSQTFHLEGFDFKRIKCQPLPKKKAHKKEPLDVSQEFEKYPLSKTHPYSISKKVSILNLGFRLDKMNNLLIPFYTLQGHFMSGYQKIWPQKDDKGKWIKTTRKGSSNKDIYLNIGKDTEKIYVAEGIATALSIHFITENQTYCTFGKNNLHSVTECLLNTFPTKQIILCLDNDPAGIYNPTIKNKRLTILCPDSPGDFNDFQDIEKEKQKLIKCQPVYEVKKELPKEVNELKKKLDNLGYEIRLNTRKDRIEIKGFDSKNYWDEVSDEGYSFIYFQVKGESGLKKENFYDRIKALANTNQVDPFQEYLKSLVWDETERLKNFLSIVFNVNKEHKELAEWAFKAILLATVRRTFEPGTKHDEFVVLQGPQGIGKSSLLYYLFKDKALFSNTVSFSDQYPRIVENILDKAIVEVAELSGFKKTDLEKMKNVITTQKDTVRLAYRRNARDYLRRCVFVGTTNDISPLPNDLTGLRRFVLISLKAKKSVSEIKKLVKGDQDQLWAEAVHYYKKNESARLPKELWDKSAEVAEDHRGGDFSFEEVFTDRVKRLETETKNRADNYVMSIPQILKFMKDGVEIESKDKDGKTFIKKEGGGWIREISPKYQSKGAEILQKMGYKMKRIREKGQRFRAWIKKKGDNIPF